jgi:hypothetical protein
MACRSIDASEAVLKVMLAERFAELVVEIEKTLPAASDSPIRLV